MLHINNKLQWQHKLKNERKMGGSIFSRSSVLIITYTYSWEDFSSSVHLFFVLWYYFDQFVCSFVCFFITITDEIIHMTVNDVIPWLKKTQESFCYISVVLTEQMVENLHISYSFRILYVTNFTIINEKNDSFLQEYSITTW